MQGGMCQIPQRKKHTGFHMNIEKQIIVDLYEVIKAQNAVLSFLVASEHALINTLVNDPALPKFGDAFQKNHDYCSTHPTGQVAEALAELQRMLGAVGEKLKEDIGEWNN
jgi:hypothetical protein